MQKLILGLLINGWLFGALLPGYAFLPDEQVGNDSGTARLSAEVQRKPTAGQKAAADRLKQVKVAWDSKTGAPLSLRGKGLVTENLGGKGLTFSGQNDFAADAVVVLDRLSAIYRLRDAAGELAAYRVATDELGFHHVRLKQMWQGRRVIGADLIVHFDKAGEAYQVNGRYIPDVAVEVKPALDTAAAVAAAQSDLAAKGKPRGEAHGTTELVVYADGVAPVLAYELTLVYQDRQAGPGCWRYWVNAQNGTIVTVYNDIQEATAEVSGKILSGEGGGNWSIDGYTDGTYYYLYNTTLHWRVFNAATSGYTDNNSTAWRATADWGDSDTTEFSAAVNFNLAQTYFNHVHSRNSYDNSNAIAVVNVHVAGGYDNAYWSPTDQQVFVYDGQLLEPVAVLDFMAHEFTHAVTEYTAGLVYQNEPGALNESFSDVFAAIVEFEGQADGRQYYPNSQPGQADWFFAEDSFRATPFAAARDMRNPQSTQVLISQPSRYKGTSWYTGALDNGGVHVNSGVQNFFFYLLCEGGQGNNDGISYNVTGIGIVNARLVAYRALTVYCAQNTDYPAVRSAWISAAQDLNTDWVSSVEAAWAAVGVGETGATSNSQVLGLNNDFDGDNIADYALYDYVNGKWYIWSSKNNAALAWGADFGAYGFWPVPGDFDGGGKADAMLYSRYDVTWRLIKAETLSLTTVTGFGGSTYIPVPGDYDGDGATDMALYDYANGAWYIYSLNTGAWIAQGSTFGGSGYLPVPGDYNGGGKSDVVVYQEATGNWLIYYAETGDITVLNGAGAPGYVAAPGDYNGDGATDLGLYNYAASGFRVKHPNI